jgi:hypothetical protein
MATVMCGWCDTRAPKCRCAQRRKERRMASRSGFFALVTRPRGSYLGPPPTGWGELELLADEPHGLRVQIHTLSSIRSLKPRPGMAVGSFTLVCPPRLVAAR